MTQPRSEGGVQPKPPLDVEVGVSAYLPFVTPYQDVWEALRDEDITVKQLTAMRKSDGQACALYRLITLPIRSALKGATFVPESVVEGGQDEADFIEQMFTLPASGGGMTVPFGRIIAQMLLAIFDGFSAFEMVYQVPKMGPLKGKWTLQKLAHRPSDTLTFLLDNRSQFNGLRQQTMYMGEYVDRKIPGEHSVYYAANEEEKPFYGRSYFQSAFYHWDKKFKLYVIAHIAAQRAAVGTRVGTLPKNPNREEKSAFQRALADLGVAQWLTMPDDYKIESLREASGFDFLALINHHNSQMSKSVLAAFFDKEQGGGDSAKLVDFGSQSDALFLLMLQTIMGEIEEVINTKIIPRFIDWNFGSGKYPKFQFGSLSQEQHNATLDLFKTLATAGQSLTVRPEMVHELEKQISEELGLEIDWETVETQMAQEKADLAKPEAPAGAAAGITEPATGGFLDAAITKPNIPAEFIPADFALTDTDPAAVALADLAYELLGEVAELTRGRPNSGGPKFVRTAAGAKTYGVPIGTAITRDIAARAGKHGPEGAPYGGGAKGAVGAAGKKAPTGPDTRTGRQVLGGGLGAQAQNLGSVNTAPASSSHPTRPAENLPAVKQTFTNPEVPGAKLLDFGDGTYALQDAEGRVSERQKIQISQFLSLGWKTTHAPVPAKPAPKAAK
jgi:hypothetical protein